MWLQADFVVYLKTSLIYKVMSIKNGANHDPFGCKEYYFS